MIVSDARDHLVAVAHALEPLMMLVVDAEQAMPMSAKGVVDGLLRMRSQLARYQVWVRAQADRGSP